MDKEILKIISYLNIIELPNDKPISTDIVNESYRKLSHIYHPDVANARYKDGKKFVELKEAREYLLKNLSYINDLIRNGFSNSSSKSSSSNNNQEDYYRQKQREEENRRKKEEDDIRRQEKEKNRKEQEARKREEKEKLENYKKKVIEKSKCDLLQIKKDDYSEKKYNEISTLFNDFVIYIQTADNLSIEDIDNRYETLKKAVGEIKTIREEIDHKKKKIRILSIFSSIAFFIVTILVLLICVFIPNYKYNHANQALSKGEYLKAQLLFSELGSFSDSKNQVDIAKAYDAFEKGNYELGIDYIYNIGGTIDVEFYSDYGTIDKSKDTIKKPFNKLYYINNNGIMKGYTLSGWEVLSYYINNNKNNYFTKISLKAQWQVNNYSIKYNLNGGSLSKSLPNKYTCNDSIILENPTKEGYTFLGWTGTAINEPSLNVNIPRGSVGNREYIANYKINQYSLNVIKDDSNIYLTSILNNDEYDYGTYMTLTANVPYGYYVRWDFSDGRTLYGEQCSFNIPNYNLEISVSSTPYLIKDGKIYFGLYPQELVTDTALINNLNKEINVEEYISKLSNQEVAIYYVDVDYDGDGVHEYRGVYFKQYWPYDSSKDNLITNTYQDDNGYYINTIYWFKFLPIEWIILEEQGDNLLLLSSLILDTKEYYPSNSDSKFNHNGGNGYANNYEISDLRIFINDVFYNRAFNEIQKKIITNTNSYHSDNVYLLSDTEASTYFSNNSSRIACSTDYAKCKGIYVSKESNFSSSWLLRSAYYSHGYLASCVGCWGGAAVGIDTTCLGGVRPVLWIKNQ